MAHQETQEWLYNELKSRGCTVGKDFNEFVNTVCADSASRDWLYNKAKGYRLGVGTREQFESWIAPEATTATPPAAPAASSSAPTAPAKAAASSSASASPHDSKQAGSGASAPLGSSAVIESQSSGTELLADFAAAMQGDWRDSLGTQAREAVAGMDALAAQSQQLAAPTHISTDSGLPALDAMAEQWNSEADQRHGALQRRLDSPGRYMIGAPQRTMTSAVEDAMGAMTSGNLRPVVLGISGMLQGGGQAAGGQGTSGSLAQAAVGPRPAGYTRNENGEMVPQWELPDGTLTTSFMTVEAAQYQANQARGIMEQERKRESALHQATVAADKAIEDEIGAYAAEQRRGNDVNLWDINPDTGVNIAGVNRYFDIEGQRARLYEGMGERIYNLLPADVRQSELANYQQYFASHPQEIPQGMTAAQAAEQSLRGWCDQQAYSYLVGKQAPQGSLEFLGRKIVQLNPAFPQMWSQLNAARQGNATLAVADQQAMSDYGAKHRALDITGTVLNMAADPLNFVGGGAASMVGKGVARAVFRKTGTNLAARLMTSRLGTSMIQGAVHGATAFAIYEGGKNIERQLTTNNYNFETGQFQGFSWGDVGSSMRHGAIMGAATGWIAPIVGNTSSKLAAGVSPTGAKAATRAGVHAVGIGVEAGIFSTASYFESGQFDFWDNLAFIVGMKASHGGRRTVSEVLGAALNRNKPFGEWIRERVSRDSREYQFTDGELAEMREAGYGLLSDVFARAGRSKRAQAETSVNEREYDSYDNVRRLMDDTQVSQATRAKVYWWLTGRKLPMSTILSAEMVTGEDGNIVVTAYTNGGEVVLRERFEGKDASKARQLYDTYNAQVESNLIEFGEQVRNRDSASDNQLGVVFSSVAEKLNVTNAGVAAVFEKMMRGTAISEFTASERLVSKEIMARLGGLQRITDAELSFGEGTSNILKYMVSEMAGVDVEAALKKGAPARSEAEQRAVDMYIDALYSQNARAARSRQLSGTKIEGDEAQAPADEAQPIEVAQAAEEARPTEEYVPKYRSGNILVGEGENARWLVLTGRENPEYQGLYEVYDPETKEVSYYTESELDEVVKEYVEFDTVAPSEAEVEAMAHSRDAEEVGEVPEGAIRIDQPVAEAPTEVPEGAIRIGRPEGEGEKPAAEVPAAEAPRAEVAEVPVAEAPATEAPATEVPAAASESALARIPVAEDGAPIFTAVDTPTAWVGLREFFGDTQAALDYATNMINAAQKRADKASKTSVPFSENPLKYRENLQKVREAVDKANAELAQWQAIAAEAQRAQEAVEMQQNAEAAAERGVVAFQPTGTVKERWDNSEKVYGLQSVIVLPDGTRVRGRYVLSHVDAATASHQPANSFARSEGFPVNENGTTINDRDYEHDKAAQEQVRKTASAYDRRALLDMPVVQDGVVLSGNERTMAAQLAARQGTNADYIAGMKESVDGKTNRWGIPLADVERFGANAAIRFEVEEVLGEGDAPQGKFPLNTKTMRRFNVKATKDQSKTEKTITFAKAMSDHTYNQLTRVVFGAGETLSDFYGKRAAVLEALNLLVEQGEITDREMPKYWDDVKGQITEEGKDLIENALLGKYFADNEQVVRVLAGMGMIRTAVVAALPELSRNAQFRATGYDLQKEVAEAILFIKKVKDAGAFKSGVPVSGFNLQNDFFDGEFGDTKVSHVSVLMIADLLNDKRTNRFREVLSDYNDFANGPANGQIDAFEGRPLTRDEVLRPIIDKIQTDYNANYGRARITEPAEAGERKQPTEAEQSGRTEQPAERAEAVAEAEDALEGDAKEQVVEGDKSPSPETKTSGGKVESPAEKPAEAVIEKPAAETEKAEESQAETLKAEEVRELEPYLNEFVGDILEDEGGMMYQKVGRVAEVGDVVRVADEVDVALVDALAERMSGIGIEVVRDGSEGQRVLDEANGGVRYDFASSEEEFEQRHRMAVEQRGVVAAGLGQMSVAVVDVPRHDFAGTFKEAVNAAEGWARANLTGREYTYGKNGGRYSISGNAVEKFLSQSAMKPSENAGVHLSALKYLPQIIEQSIDVEIHPDYVKGENSLRAVENGIGRGDVLVHRLYGCINIDGQLYRVKTTMYEYRRTSEQKKNTPHSYEVTKIELLEAPWWNDHQHAAMTSSNSISGAKLLQNVEKSYEKGKKVLDESRKNGAQLHKVYHGSGTDFDAFDFGHMGEGEGAQAFGWGGYVTEVEGIGRTYAHQKEDTSGMMLYTIDIPQDNGRNYLHWEKTVGENAAREMRKRLYEHMIRVDEEGLYGDAISRKELERELAAAFSGDMVGADLYGTVSSYLGSDKAASEFLRGIGFVGVSYPAGERNDVARNYVIFRESDMRITDKVRFFRTKDGEAYGFTVGGKIYIDPRYVNAETPIHEYTHLWAEALRRGNAEEWRNVIELMRGTSVWDEVREQYPELKTEDEIAEEVLAQYSGRRGAERLREEMRKAAHGEGTTMDKARAVSVLERVRLALERFWRSVADFLHVHFTSAEEVADRVLADLLNGVNPLRSVEERAIVERAKADGTYMKAPNGQPTKLSERQWVQVRTKAFKEWFGDWEKAARIEKLRKSEPVVASGEEYKGQYELTSRSAEEYVLKTLRGEYTNEDTGDNIKITRASRKVLHHDVESDIHLKSIALIPQMIEKAIFVDEIANEKGSKFDTYRYYVVGLKIGGEDYTAKIVVGTKDGESYYDHSLTQIEKSSLIDLTDGVKADVSGDKTIFDGKDKRLFSILQINSSKVVDENGEPLVMWHETGSVFTIFNPRRVGAGASDYMTPFGIFLKDSPAPIGVARGGNVKQMALYVKMRNPIEFANREEMESYLRSKCEGYAQLSDSIKNIDAEYGKKYDDAEKAENDAMMDIYLNHPEIWNDEARRDGAVEKYSSEVDRILKEWQGAEGRMSAELKEITDRFFRGSGHDGIILNTDEGSFGRKTRTNIVFNPNQVKSATENVGTFDGGNADIRYQFIGERGAGALDRAEEASVRLDNLAVAREMEAAGKDALTVKMATGWERGADGKWRYEIMDVGLDAVDATGNLLAMEHNPEYRRYAELGQKLAGDGLEGKPLDREAYDEWKKLNSFWGDIRKVDNNYKVGAYLDAPELYVAYPELKDLALTPKQLSEGTLGSLVCDFMGAPIRIEVSEALFNAGRERKLLSVILHEVQHAIQAYEGFAKGGNAAINANYRRLGGEVESRNVQARMNMSAEERRRTLAEATEDVAREDQVMLLYALDESQMTLGEEGSFEPEVVFGKVNESTTEGEVADGGVGLLYREVDDRAVLDEFAEGKTVKVYRTMQVIDGKLYSPMATKVGGKSTPEIRLGVVEQSEEHPEIIKSTRTDAKTGEQYGYVVIDKGQNKGTLEVAYNPYMHCSRTVLNDQFTSAHIRPNLVIVEVEVPASELSSGYRANMAKNSVGEMSWHSGSVSGKLSKLGKPRRVILSRYDRPVRVVPFREVAEKIAEQLAGTDIEIPYNVVQPQLREELEALGVRISEKASGSVGKKNDFGKAEYVTDEDIAAINARAQSEQTVGVKRQRAEEAASEMGVQVRFIESKDVPAGVNAERQRRALGWFDPATGEVVVVLDNNADAAAAVATVYHEVVAHKGLRELVGKENMSTFLRQVYAAADETIRREIAETAARHGYNMETATEEYLARLAEKGFDDFAPKQRSLWKRLRDFIVNLLRKCLRLPKWVKLHDNELRQILYASYENLKGKSAEARGKSGAVREAASAEGLLYSDGMDLEATVTKGKIDLALRNQDDRDLREQAIAAINGNLQQLRRAMRAQRNYDRSTVKSLTDLVRAMIGGKQLHGMSDYELSRLFVAIRDAVGRDDYSKQVDKVMDILIKNQLSQAEEALDKLMRIRGSKVDAKGVEVQGTLDLRGQAIMKEFKAALKLNDADLSQAIAKAANDAASPNPVIADDAQNKMNAYAYVQIYNASVRDSELDELMMRRQLADEELRYKSGEITRDEWQAFELATRDAIRENRMLRVKEMRDLISQLAYTLNQSIAAAQSFAQAQIQRMRQIQHEANSDLQGVPYGTQHPETAMQKIKNSPLVQLFAQTLPSFDAIMRLISKNAPNGEGYLWNRFMRGFVDAVENERTAYLQAKATLDKEVQMIFGAKYTWDKLAHKARKMKLTDGRTKMSVTIHDGGAQRQVELTSGELMYLYMVNKMTDGEMKLRRMGITEADIAAIEQLLDPRLVRLADWLQESFFVGLRASYNEVHKRMFGASMAAIDNYVPLKILDTAIQKQEDIAAPDMDNKRSATTTGSIIKRTVNSLPIDLMHCNIFDVVNQHVIDMNHWAAFAELSRDLNTLLSYNLFKNRLRNMQSILGSGELLLKRLQTAAAIMTGNYRPNATRPDVWAVNLARGVTSAKVAARLYTAFKQLSSMPAFLSEARADFLAASMATPWISFNWCLKNLPMFEKRWIGRMAGNEKLTPSDLDWGVWRNESMEKITRWGLTPNGFIDAVTVAIGAYAIYNTRLRRYLRDGYSQDDAERRAKQDANIIVNKSQQSSESAFLSEMQVARSWWSIMFTAFRNSPISYQRMVAESWRNIGRRLRGDKGQGIEFLKKQLLRQWGFEIDANGVVTGPDYNGMDAQTAEGMAEAAAKREYRRAWMRDIMNSAIYGFVMQLFWNIFGKLPYLIVGGLLFSADGDEEKQLVQDETVHAALGGMVEGLSGGEVISDGLAAMANAAINGEEMDAINIAKSTPLGQDIERISEMYGVDAVAATGELTNTLISMGFGANPATITDAALAIYDACQGDMQTSREVAFCLMRIAQVPQSQLDKMYFDELGCTGAEARLMSPVQVAERYAQYKVMRAGGLMQWMYSDELYNRRVSAYRKRAMTILKGKMPGLWSDSVNESYEQARATTQRVRSASREERYDGRFSEADFRTYLLFPKLDRNFRHISEAYLNAETPQDANRYMDALIEYKPLMMGVLNATDEAERERLYEQLITRYNELNIEEK